MIDVEKLAISFGFTTPPRVKGGKFLTLKGQEKLKKKKQQTKEVNQEKKDPVKQKKVQKEEEKEKKPEQKSRKIKKAVVRT